LAGDLRRGGQVSRQTSQRREDRRRALAGSAEEGTADFHRCYELSLIIRVDLSHPWKSADPSAVLVTRNDDQGLQNIPKIIPKLRKDFQLILRHSPFTNGRLLSFRPSTPTHKTKNNINGG